MMTAKEKAYSISPEIRRQNGTSLWVCFYRFRPGGYEILGIFEIPEI